MIELFAKIVSGQKLLTIFAKKFIADVWQDPKNTSEGCYNNVAPTLFQRQGFVTTFQQTLFSFLVPAV